LLKTKLGQWTSRAWENQSGETNEREIDQHMRAAWKMKWKSWRQIEQTSDMDTEQPKHMVGWGAQIRSKTECSIATNQNYNWSTKITVLSPSFDLLKSKMVRGTLLIYETQNEIRKVARSPSL
jgi:hypothetical protein